MRATVTKLAQVPDSELAEFKRQLAYFTAPGTWADGWTEKAFQQRWGMSSYEATQLLKAEKMSRPREQYDIIRVTLRKPQLRRLMELIEEQPQQASDMRLYLLLKDALARLER